MAKKKLPEPTPSPIQLSPEQMAQKAGDDAFIKDYEELCQKHSRSLKAVLDIRAGGITPNITITDNLPAK